MRPEAEGGGAISKRIWESWFDFFFSSFFKFWHFFSFHYRTLIISIVLLFVRYNTMEWNWVRERDEIFGDLQEDTLSTGEMMTRRWDSNFTTRPYLNSCHSWRRDFWAFRLESVSFTIYQMKGLLFIWFIQRDSSTTDAVVTTKVETMISFW